MRKVPPEPAAAASSAPPRNGGGGELRSEMGVENFGYEETRRCKRMTPTSIESLLDDIVFTILVKLPTQDIYDAARLVCRKWYRMIRSQDFVRAHLQCSPTGLLIQSQSCSKINPVFVAMNRGRIEIYKFKCCKFKETIWSSCNGLLLLCDHDKHTLFVVNPATKQRFSIPPFPAPIFRNCFSGLGYDAASMEYKVVHVETPKKCAILTVGVDDSWRPLPIEHLSNSGSIYVNEALVTEGFVHWVSFLTDSLVTLNLETETISDIPIPQGLGWCYCFSTRKCLSFITVSLPKLCWGVWEMRPGPVEWERLADIDLEDQKCTLENMSSNGKCILEPVGWIIYREVLLFLLNYRTHIVYNVCTTEIKSFELDFYSQSHPHVAHTNTLVWLGGCQS